MECQNVGGAEIHPRDVVQLASGTAVSKPGNLRYESDQVIEMFGYLDEMSIREMTRLR